jgi:GMP synthase-like glutamine amidotransferase
LIRTHILQHATFEGVGSIDHWLTRHNASLTVTRFFDADAMPITTDGIDLVIAMGGPMSVNDEQELPWLKDEKRFLKQAMANHVPTLGICLGAQLIASALGASVYANAEKEIGWFPIRAVAAAHDGRFEFPRELMAFHWHGETFDLPAVAMHLAESEACRVQAFQIGRHVIGMQFHPEMTLSGARLLVEHSATDLTLGRCVQPEAAILFDDVSRFTAAHAVMDRILDYLTRDIREVAA